MWGCVYHLNLPGPHAKFRTQKNGCGEGILNDTCPFSFNTHIFDTNILNGSLVVICCHCR